jgi:hypothetical protein
MFYALVLIFGVTEGVRSVFIFCALWRIFGGTEGVGSRFHVLCARTYFQQYRGHRLPLSCFCVPGLIFGGPEGAGSRFHILRSRTRFRRYGVRWVSISCFAIPDSFSAVPRASGSVFMFCTSGLIFGGIEGVGNCFHVLRSLTHFRRYRGRRVPFSFFALPNSSSAVPWSTCLVFLFCAPAHVFGGSEGVESQFLVLCSRCHFRRYRERHVPFPCFAHPDKSSAVPRESSTIFIFYAPGVVSRGTEGVRSCFHVLCSRTHFRRYCATLFRALLTADGGGAMGCGRRIRRFLLNVHLFRAGWTHRSDPLGCTRSIKIDSVYY